MARAKLSAVETGARRKAKKKKKTRTRLGYLVGRSTDGTSKEKAKKRKEWHERASRLSAGGFPGPHTSLREKYQLPWKFHLNHRLVNDSDLSNFLQFRFCRLLEIFMHLKIKRKGIVEVKKKNGGSWYINIPKSRYRLSSITIDVSLFPFYFISTLIPIFNT